MTSSEEVLDGVARTLVDWPASCLELVARHRAGPDGRCSGCGSQVRSAPLWPCALYVVADHALRLRPPHR